MPMITKGYEVMPAKMFRIASVLIFGFSSALAFANSPLVLSGINDRGADLDAHAFELYGSFPSPELVRPIVTCNGVLRQAEVMAALIGQINVNVEAIPSSSTCVFQLQRITDLVKSGTLTVITSRLSLEIKGRNDRGITGGRR